MHIICVDPRLDRWEDSHIADARDNLIALVSEHGPALADDERRLDALLTDACGPSQTQEVLLLVSAAMAGVPKVLGGRTTVSEGELDRLAKQLSKEFGTGDVLARWSVDSWAKALNVKRGVTAPVAVSTSASSEDATDPDPFNGEAPEEVLRRAIRDARADGEITPEEREQLAALAAKVKARLGGSGRASTGAVPAPVVSMPWWKQRIALIAAGVVAVLALVAGIALPLLTRPSKPDPAAVERDAARANLLQAVESRRVEWQKLHEAIELRKSVLTTARETLAAQATDVGDFRKRLARAAEAAADQGRDQFKMAGRTYTAGDAGRVLEAAAKFVNDRQATLASSAADLAALDASSTTAARQLQGLDAIAADAKETLVTAGARLADASAAFVKIRDAVQPILDKPAPPTPAFDVGAAVQATP
ncbi:MAG: hypothetical protein QM770_14125 [Tepidisphaeraceae bacterium]